MSSAVLNNEKLSDAYKSFLQYIPHEFHITGQCTVPQILVSGINNNDALTFPLSESMIAELIKLSKPSPFGQGTETKYDEKVRLCKELDNTQFTLNTETFSLSSKSNQCLESIRKCLMPHLEYIECKPYKLLIYETHSFFQSHVDTPVEDNQFASLILSFPTQKTYEGGDFILNFNEHHIKWNPDTKQSNICPYISYFSNIHHQVEPLHSGIRIVMTFNLSIPSDIKHDIFEKAIDKNQNVYVTPTESSELELNKYYSPWVEQVFTVLSNCVYCKELKFPTPLIWMILEYHGDHEAIQLMRNVLNDDKFHPSGVGTIENGICVILSHLYHGEFLNPLCLKGEDMYLYRILKQYFGVLLSGVTVKVHIGVWSDECPDADYRGRIIERWEPNSSKASNTIVIGSDGFCYTHAVPDELKKKIHRSSEFVVLYNNKPSALKHGDLENVYDTCYGNCGSYNIHNLYRCAGLVLMRYKPTSQKKRVSKMDEKREPPTKKQKT